MYFNINQFIKYKIHIGHSYKVTKFLSSWLLYRLQGNIWIINIFKTIIFLKNIIIFLKYLVCNNFPIWFINLELTKEFMFLIYSKLCGEFASTRYWIRGMLSNYISISKSLKKYASKKYVYKSSIFLKIINNWYITRYTWPRAIFISNIDSNYIVCKEAALMLLPIIGIIDSNTKSFLIKLPIISNDDSMESFYFILNLITKLILLFKYNKIVLWFSNYKKKIKEINFKKLISYFYIYKKKIYKNTFRPISLFNVLSKNFNKIEIFFNKYYNLNSFFNKTNIISFDINLLKKNIYYKQFIRTFIYKFNFRFNRKYRIKASKFKPIIALHSFLKKRRKYYNLNKWFNLMFKYSSFFFTSFMYSMKYSRIFYNSFLLKKINKLKIFDIAFPIKIYKKNLKFNILIENKKKEKKTQLISLNHDYFQIFPYFFFRKKKYASYKNYKKIYHKIYDKLDNKLLLNYYNKFSKKLFYIKIFIELYYNKWFIYLLNLL